MSIATEISRIQSDRNTIRNKLIELGLAASTDNLDKLAAVIENIMNRGAVSVNVKEGETYTIPAGYHNGSGTVSGVAGGGNYSLQSKTATPTKKQQNVTPDSGYYGLSDVTVAAIPEAFQDVTSVTATAGDVLTGKVFVAADGTIITGTMPNNGTVEKTLSVTAVEYTIPKGYHSGTGKVSIALEAKTVTPTKAAQTVTPSTGSVLSQVKVEPIPDNFVDTTDADALPGHILEGSTAYVDTVKVAGTMKNNGTTNKLLTASDPTFTIPQGYHDGSGDVFIMPESKTVTPTKEEQTVTPADGKVLSDVVVEPIPDEYQDVSGVTATAADVLNTKYIVLPDGTKVKGTIVQNIKGTTYLGTGNTSKDISGYWPEGSSVKVELEEKTVTPTKSEQVIKPEGALAGGLSRVTVNPIPDEYQDVSEVTAAANTVLAGSIFVDSDGNVVEGQIESYSGGYSIDGLTVMNFTIPEGFHTGSTVTLTSDIEEALAAI